MKEKKNQKTTSDSEVVVETGVSKPLYIYCNSCKFRSMDNLWEDWCYSNAPLDRGYYGEYHKPVKCKAKNIRNDCNEYQPRWWKRLFNLFKAC